MSFKARISAIDNFSGTFNKISDSVKKTSKSLEGINPPTGKIEQFTNSFKSIASGVVVGNVVTGALSKITGGLGSMMGELSQSSATWKTFNGVMKNFGKSDEYIASVKNELQDFATQTIYSSSEMASTFAQLEAVGTKNSRSLVKAFGGLAGAAENPKQAMKSLSQQATQMASKPKIAWEDFKIMLEQSPAGMAQVAKEMGMSVGDLTKQIQSKTGVATDDFFAALDKAGNAPQFQKMATQFKTVGEATDGLRETLANKLQPAFDIVSGAIIKGISSISDWIGNLNFTPIKKFYDFVVKYGDIFKPLVAGLGTAIGVFSAITLGVYAYTKAVSLAKLVSELFGKSLFANPLGLLVLAISAVVGALVYFARNTETGRKAMQKLNQVAEKVGSYFKNTLGKALEYVGDKWQELKQKLSDLGFFTTVKDIFETVKGVVSDFVDKMGGLKNIFSIVAGFATKFGIALLGFTGPIGLAISLLVSLFTSWAKTGELNADGFTKIFDDLSQTISNTAGFISDNLPKFLEVGTKILTKIVEGFTKALPKITETATQLINVIVKSITDNLPTLISVAVQILQTLVQSLVTNLPTLVNAAVQIITTLVNGLIKALPTIIDAAIQIIMALANGLIAMLPTIIDGAFQIIMALVQGLIDNLPTIIDSAVQIIMALFTAIIDNLPKIIDSAIQIITTLFQGIIDNLPKIIEAGINLIVAIVSGIIDNLPKIIEAALNLIVALAEALIENLPKIIEAGGRILIALAQGIWKLATKLFQLGIDLIGKLIGGLGNMLGKVGEKAGEIGNSIWEKIKSIDLLQVGKDIIQGLINGIGSMIGGIGKAIGDVAGKITGGIKEKLGIASPSKVMKRMGAFTGQGLQIGIDSMGSKISKSADKMAQLATPSIKPIDVGSAFSSATGNFTSSLSADVQGQLQVSQQPAEINLNLGNRDFNAFVSDISRNQDQSTQLRTSYGF